MALPALSYAQQHEDTLLLYAFDGQADGFFIDIGAGHPVYDNVTLAFYQRGWRGITVEPNPWLDELTAAVRPRDTRVRALVGAEAGEARYFQVEDFHGLSTTVAANAEAAEKTFGKGATEQVLQVVTLRELCERHAPGAIDVLKVDVEGAERTVIEGNDWTRFRPKVAVLEAVAPVTMQPSWDDWEPLLLAQDYIFAHFDGLNRFYVAREHPALAERLAAAPPFDAVPQFRTFGPAASDPTHPDHDLARRLAGLDPVRLPLLQRTEIAAALGPAVVAQDPGSKAFMLALGRISASSAW